MNTCLWLSYLIKIVTLLLYLWLFLRLCMVGHVGLRLGSLILDSFHYSSRIEL